MDFTLLLELLLFFCVPSILAVLLMFDVVMRRMSARAAQDARGPAELDQPAS